MQLQYLTALAALTATAFADIKFTSPAAAAQLAGGSTISVEWTDSGTAPAITDLSSYQLFLCAGGNTDGSFIQLAAITTQGQFAAGNKAQGTIQAGVGASTPKNAYFLKMISVATTGGTVVNYSPRFTLSGMTGTFPQTVIDGATAVTTTDGPATQNNVAAANPAAGQPAGAAQFTVPYNMQTGLTKYAPMMSIPPNKITRKDTAPLYPTSAVTIAKTFMGKATVLTTLTASQTFSVSQMENTASAAAPPDDMQKFLARWKD